MLRRIGLMVLLLGVAMIGTNCSSVKTFVLKPVAKPYQASSAEIIEVSAPVPLPPEMSFVDLRFKRKIEELLYQSGTLQKGNALRIEYTILEIDPGDHTARTVVGFGTGKGVLKVGVKYFDAAKNELSEILVESKVNVDENTAIQKAVQAIRKYTRKNFVQMK